MWRMSIFDYKIIESDSYCAAFRLFITYLTEVSKIDLESTVVHLHNVKQKLTGKLLLIKRETHCSTREWYWKMYNQNYWKITKQKTEKE